MRAVGFLSLLVAVGLSACGGARPTPADEPRPVRVETIGGARGPDEQREVVGVVRAAERATLSFQVPGRIAALNVEIGDAVARGQVIAVLDAAPFDLRVRQADAETGRARAVLVEAQGRLDRQQRLADDGWVAPAAVDAVRAEVDAARAGVDAAAAAAALARRDASLSRLRAPFSGRIAARSVDPFAEVQPGLAIVELDGAGLETVAPVPAAWASSLLPGTPVVLRTGERALAGTVSDVSPRAGEAGVVEAIIALAADTPVRPGDAVRMALPVLPEAGSGLTIPYGAILLSEQADRGRVFVIADGRAQPRAIAFARVGSDRAEVTSGLRRGDVVVTAGARFLTAGQRVVASADRTR